MTSKRRNVLLLVLLGLLAIGTAAWALHARRTPDTQTGGKEGRGPAGAEGPGNRPVPVAAATVERRDVPIYLEGLGSVVAFKTVTLRSQVDGRLVRVAFDEGQEVKKGDLLAQIDPRPFQIQLQQAEAALTRDRATLRNNHLNLDRYQTLRKQDLVQQQTVDDQQALVDQGQASTQVDQAQVDTARLNLDYARITSPIDGKTGVRLVDQGNLVRAADATGLVVITQLDPIAVLFTLPEDVLPQVIRQMNLGPLNAQAQSRDGLTDLGTGKVALVDNQINQATGTIRLKAVFDNPQRLLWPNQFVKIRLLLMVRKNATVVPAQVVQRGPQGTFAYVIEKDQTVSQRPIEVESTEGTLAILKSGLEPGEEVVTDGQYQLKPRAKVSVHQPESQGGNQPGKPDRKDGQGKKGGRP